MRRLLTLIVFSAIACGPPRRLDPCSPSGTGVPEQPVLVALVGQPVELELLLPPAVFCPGGNPVATAVVTEVLDAMNRPVAHTNSSAQSSSSNGYSTQVSFTPTTPGAHYLNARFEPALGVTQRQLQVALERSADPPWQRTTLGALCDEVLPLREAVICKRGSQITLVRDGGVELTESATSIASSGATGWLWTDSRLTRLFDGAGGVERSDFALTTSTAAFGVSEDKWVQPRGAGFVEVSYADGGLSERQRNAGLGGGVSGPHVAISGETLGWATTTSVCALAPDASVHCVDSELQPAATEGNGLWLRGASGVMAFARFDPRGSTPVVIFVAAQPAALQEARLSRPVFSSAGRLIAVRADDLSFEAWRSPGPLARQSVTEGFVVFQLQSGETVIYRR